MNRVLDKIIGGILEILMVAMVAVVILQVLARYVIAVSIPWTEEAARYMLAGMTFLGSAIALKEGKHIVVDFLYQRVSAQHLKFLNIFFSLLILAFLLALIWGGLKLIEGAWDVPTASLPWFTMGQIYLIMPIGLIVMIWFEIGLLWHNWKARKKDL